MRQAVREARKGEGCTRPNPPVGAVIVKAGRVIGKGYHHAAGMPHAEIEASNSCRGSAKGAALYVTLEPCCHHGNQPPCVDAIIEENISSVFIGISDPNPLVANKGIQKLKSAGVDVQVGIIPRECE